MAFAALGWELRDGLDPWKARAGLAVDAPALAPSCMASHLTFAIDDLRLEIVLWPDRAPRTVAALVRSLPAVVDLHCAKIAGNHLFWHAPFLEPLEAGSDVMAAPAGSLLYWPERQFLELIYGPLQAETASVTLLGHLIGEVAPLRDLGERLAREQGHRPFDARLELAGERPAPAGATVPLALAPLVATRRAMWAGEPAEVRALLARRGVMLPAGPLVMAESEARKLQEQLWLLWSNDAADDPAFAARAAVRLVEGARSRLEGLCGLHDAGTVLGLGRELLATEPSHTAAILAELILWSGRLAAWLDRRLPWDAMNETVLHALDDWPVDDR